MISPGVVHGLMSTLDIMPTVLGILGVDSSLLDGILLDGLIIQILSKFPINLFTRYDLSKTLTEEVDSPRKEMVYIYPSATDATGIHALRYGKYKAHFVTQGGIFAANQDLDCIRFAQVKFISLLTNEYKQFAFRHIRLQ